MATTIKLTYFPLPGRAGSTRLAFYVGGVDFEDVIVKGEDFQAMKDSLPGKQLPVLEVNGVTYCESMAILRYAGKLSGLYPSDPVEALKCDMVIDMIQGAGDKVAATIREPDAEKKMKMREELASQTLPTLFGYFEEQLNKFGGNFCIGDQLTIADLELLIKVTWLTKGILDGIPPSWIDPFTKVKAIVEATKNHEKVAEYYASGKV
eukprot:CAMPEP_0113941348 /NCGR_PEP_ID=MMETSP1339-20121228/7285_1 /TAXON_ID=94617 /ORGANISM="Fibrocapsa japonica" /LENGTH=206 /DNA_ID=CAMNT_0000945465 /DNA_START=49 /DNA_END=669 /DNA_ORIENTATION=- /assembly_acc=CAM_ASM_000762